MHDVVLMEEGEGRGQLRDVESDGVFWEGAQTVEVDCGGVSEERGEEEGRTAQVTAEHEIEDKEAVVVVLEGISEVDDKGMVDLERDETER